MSQKMIRYDSLEFIQDIEEQSSPPTRWMFVFVLIPIVLIIMISRIYNRPQLKTSKITHAND